MPSRVPLPQRHVGLVEGHAIVMQVATYELRAAATHVDGQGTLEVVDGLHARKQLEHAGQVLRPPLLLPPHTPGAQWHG
jgi:hypothetical protein